MAKHYKPSKLTKELQKMLEEREERGIQTYGNTLEGNDLPAPQLAQHALEEALDQSVYLKALKPKLEHIIGENVMLRKENDELRSRNSMLEHSDETPLVDQIRDHQRVEQFLRSQINRAVEVASRHSVSTTFSGDLPLYIEAVLAVQVELCEAEVEKYRNRNDEPLREALATALGYQIDDELEDGAVMATHPNGGWDMLPEMEHLVAEVKMLRANNLGLRDLIDDTRKFIYDHDLDGNEEGEHLKRRLTGALSSPTTIRELLGADAPQPTSGATEGAGVEVVAEVLCVETTCETSDPVPE